MEKQTDATHQTVVPTPTLVANYLLAGCRDRGDAITNLKLQKLLYYSDAWSLALFDRELIKENFEAWVHGPVLLSQYHRFKQHKWMPITDECDAPVFDSKIEGHLEEIIETFGVETAVALELMTHKELPWIEARGNLSPSEPSDAKISKKTMKDYYRSI